MIAIDFRICIAMPLGVVSQDERRPIVTIDNSPCLLIVHFRYHITKNMPLHVVFQLSFSRSFIGRLYPSNRC